jgi:hypothetical protein
MAPIPRRGGCACHEENILGYIFCHREHRGRRERHNNAASVLFPVTSVNSVAKDFMLLAVNSLKKG